MKTDWLRTSLIGGIALLCFLLMIRWNDFQERNHQATAQAEQKAPVATQQESSDDDFIPELQHAAAETIDPGQSDAAKQTQITVTTDVLKVTIDSQGGDIVRVALPKFFKKINTPDDPFVLIDNDQGHTYLARSGLIGQNGTDASNKPRPIFYSAKTNYTLTSGEDILNVDLTFTQEDGVHLTKRFSFARDSYAIKISYIVNNSSDATWIAATSGQIKRDSHNPIVSSGLGMKPFLGAATTTVDTNYKKYSFSKLEDEKVKHSRTGGWVAMVQHYFLSAWIAPENSENTYELRKSKNKDIYYLQFTSSPFSVPAGKQGEQSFQFYAGPKDIRSLEKLSPHLDLTVDYSFLWWIAKPLFYGLDFIHSFVGNWGIAIILLTLVVKLIFFYPSATSYRSMAKMRKLQPKMAELKERYGDDRQKMSMETMKMYRTEKVNPLGGCLPILIQMPVFLALYWVLMESVELRQAPFFFWIKDLSVKDPFYVLPLIMGVTMFIQQKLNPAPTDPMQAKVMQMMPVFFTFLMLFFPSGLVLYWVVNNSLSITQQYFITKHIENQ